MKEAVCRTRLQLSILRSLSRQLERAIPEPLGLRRDGHSQRPLLVLVKSQKLLLANVAASSLLFVSFRFVSLQRQRQNV